MMKTAKLMHFALLFSLLFALATDLDGQDVKSSVSRDSILIGDQIDRTVSFSIKEGEAFVFEKPEEVQGVEVIKPLSFDTVSSRRGTLNIEGHTILTSFDSGSYFLPPLKASIQHSDGHTDTLIFEGKALAVNTIPIDTATFVPYDIKGQIRYPVTFKEVALWTGGILLLTAAALVLIRWIRYRKENRSFFGKSVEKEPAHITALRSLESIRSQKLWQNDKQKLFYTSVTDTLRQYIAERYGIPALEETSAEIFSHLKNQTITPELLDKLETLFKTADFVKFAKHSASNEENEEAIPTAVRFVNETFMQQLENEDKEV